MDKGALIVGSVNHDAIYNVEHLPKPHETIPASHYATAPGGKGANQAAACAVATERPVHMLGAVGQDMHAQFCLAYLESQRVDVSNIVAREDLPTGTACILVDAEGDNLIIVAAGANGGLTPADIADAHDLFAQSEVILNQLESPLETVRACLAQARALGKTAILNPAPYLSGAQALLPLADIVTPNQTEASALTGLNVSDEEGARKAAKALLEQGAREAIITLGANGSLVATQTQTVYLPAYRVATVIDTSGAGDVYNGALAAALCDGASLLDATDFASAAASMSVQKPTASHCAPAREEIIALQATKAANRR